MTEGDTRGIMRGISRKVYAKYIRKPRFSRPTELLEALEGAKEVTGKYPVYTGIGGGSFLKFVTGEELAKFKHFRLPRWKRHGKSNTKIFSQEVSDTYAGGMFPDRTPYSVSGMWNPDGLFDGDGSKVQYSVSIFVDHGRHIDTQRVETEHPVAIEKVLAKAVAQSLEKKGKCFDGYWY